MDLSDGRFHVYQSPTDAAPAALVPPLNHQNPPPTLIEMTSFESTPTPLCQKPEEICNIGFSGWQQHGGGTHIVLSRRQGSTIIFVSESSGGITTTIESPFDTSELFCDQMVVRRTTSGHALFLRKADELVMLSKFGDVGRITERFHSDVLLRLNVPFCCPVGGVIGGTMVGGGVWFWRQP